MRGEFEQAVWLSLDPTISEGESKRIMDEAMKRLKAPAVKKPELACPLCLDKKITNPDGGVVDCPRCVLRLDRLVELRRAGWSVAVHNDYRQGGAQMTFWLLTHPSGRWVKGEGLTDEHALEQAFVASGLTQAEIELGRMDAADDTARVAGDMGKVLASLVPEVKVTRNLHDDPIILSAAADALRKAEKRPPWSTGNLPGNDVARVREVLVVVDAYLEEKGR